MIDAEIVDIEERPDKNISIFVSFSQDGKEVPFWKGGQVLVRNGRNVWELACRLENFLTMTDAEKQTWVDKNIEWQFNNVVPIFAKEAKNAEVIADLKRLVGGRTYQKDTVEVSVGINGTGDRIVTLKDDGTYIENVEAKAV